MTPNEEAAADCIQCGAATLLHERYRLRSPLASRGEARTYAATDTQEAGAEVVVKELSLAAAGDWKKIELFERSVRVLRFLDSDGVPDYVDDFQQERGGVTHYFLVQRRVPGVSLAEALERGERFDEARARRIAGDVLATLEYLQSLSPPVIHRDIKPANIMAAEDGGHVLVDFDIVQDEARPHGGSTTALGTAGYAPLEQLMGRATPASDIYGLGATLISVLARKDAADLFDVGTRRLEFDDYVNVGEAFRRVLHKMVEPSVEDRFVDAAEVATALRSGTGESAPLAPPPPSRGDADADADAEPIRTHAGSEQDATSVAVASDVDAILARIEEQPPRAEVTIGVPLSWKTASNRLRFWTRVALSCASVGLSVQFLTWASLGFLVAVWVVAWFATGFLLRQRVSVAADEAIHYGAIGNETGPAQLKLRPGVGQPYKITLRPFGLIWDLAPLELEGGPVDVSLRLNVAARSGKDTDFKAVMNLDSWNRFPQRLFDSLREHPLRGVLWALLDNPELVDQAQRGHSDSTQDLTDRMRGHLDSGLAKIGLKLMAEPQLSLRPSTSDHGHRIQVVPADP